jgi:endogenous inhibitor of DNA gyrase (YacG/DUF329 family)
MRHMVQAGKGKPEILFRAVRRRPIGGRKNERASSSLGQREDWRQRCEWCGTLLPETADIRKRFCNRRCKRADYDALIARERAAARAKLTCQRCGKSIKGAKRQDRKYCSLRCQERARYWRHREDRLARAKAYYRRRLASRAVIPPSASIAAKPGTAGRRRVRAGQGEERSSLPNRTIGQR